MTLKEKLLGTGSDNLEDLEAVINEQVSKGYRLHSFSTSNGGSKGFAGGDRIQATLVFERIDLETLFYEERKKYKASPVDNPFSKEKVASEIHFDRSKTTTYTILNRDEIQCDRCEEKSPKERLGKEYGFCWRCGAKFVK